MTPFDNAVTMIVRTVGERTLPACIDSIVGQGIAKDNIIIINSAPFSDTLRKSLYAGLAAEREWTFCIDADVVLAPGSIRRLYAFASKTGPETCEVQGYVLDKFFGGHRPAGNHFYRTRHLKAALECIPEEGVDIRPESRMLTSMGHRGMFWRQVPCLIGLHDFGQYYRDIFRKAFVQAHKHYHLKGLFDKVWGRGMLTDLDFAVADMGYRAGESHEGHVFIDIRQSCYKQYFEVQLVAEKPPLSAGELSTGLVEETIRSWTIAKDHERSFPEWPSYPELLVNRFESVL